MKYRVDVLGSKDAWSLAGKRETIEEAEELKKSMEYKGYQAKVMVEYQEKHNNFNNTRGVIHR